MKLLYKSLIFFYIFFNLCNLLFAQEVKVIGNKRIEANTIKSYFDSKKQLSDKEINKILKKLYKTNLFHNITIKNSPDYLEVKIIENPIISKIKIIGNKKISDEVISQEMSLQERDVYTKNTLNSDITRLYQIYKRSGRINAVINPRVKFLEQNRIDLILDIKENSQVKINKIFFHGNNKVSTRKLKKILASKEDKWYRGSSSFFDPDKVSFDKQLLNKFYFNKGYANFNISNNKIEYLPELKGFIINFFLQEGHIYNFSKINFSSEYAKLDTRELTKKLAIKKGDRFSLIKIDESIDNLLFYLNNKGFAFADIDYKINKDSINKLVDINFNIQKNKKIYIRNIHINGNDRTEDKVIRRELKILSGDPYSNTKIKRSKQRIMNLGFFSKVEIKKEPIMNKNLIDITFEVMEKPTGELNFGLGYSTTEKFLGEISVREKNLLGKGHAISLVTKKSARGNNIDISYTVPNFMEREFSFQNRIFNISNNYDESNADMESKGFSTGINYELSEYLTQSLNYMLKQEAITNISSTASIYIQEQEGERLYSGFSQGLYYDKRNNRFNPNKGYYLKLLNNFAGLGGDVKLTKSEISAVNYKPFFKDKLTVKSLFKTGAVFGFSNQDITINHRFFLGGSSLRGFRYAGIGPRDENDAALGGNYFYQSSLEILFPLGLPEELGFKGSVFTDFGSVFGLDKNANNIMDGNKIRASFGLGVFWNSPLGPISFNFANAISKETFDKTETFRINFGTRF